MKDYRTGISPPVYENRRLFGSGRKIAIAGALVALAAVGLYLLYFQFAVKWPGEREEGPVPLPEGLSAEEICPEEGRRVDCWIEVANQRGCYVWVVSLQPDHTLRWDGECSAGLGEGQGALIEKEGTFWISYWSNERGLLERGLRQGNWTTRNSRGIVVNGAYLDGEKHGTWIGQFPNGSTFEQRFLLGEAYTRLVIRNADGEVTGPTLIEDTRTGDQVIPQRDGGEEAGRMENGSGVTRTEP